MFFPQLDFSKVSSGLVFLLSVCSTGSGWTRLFRTALVLVRLVLEERPILGKLNPGFRWIYLHVLYKDKHQHWVPSSCTFINGLLSVGVSPLSLSCGCRNSLTGWGDERATVWLLLMSAVMAVMSWSAPITTLFSASSVFTRGQKARWVWQMKITFKKRAILCFCRTKLLLELNAKTAACLQL